MSTGDRSLWLEQRDGEWLLAGSDAERFGLVNEYLSHLADRNCSPRTVRAYGFDLLAFCRWLRDAGIDLAAVTTDVLLRFLAACRDARVPASGWSSARGSRLGSRSRSGDRGLRPPDGVRQHPVPFPGCHPAGLPPLRDRVRRIRNANKPEIAISRRLIVAAAY